MRIIGCIIAAAIISQLCGCSDSDTIHIQHSGRLEDTAAGAWLGAFGLSYAEEDARHLTIKIRDKLRSKGTVLDTYTQGKGTWTVVYSYPNDRLRADANTILNPRDTQEPILQRRSRQLDNPFFDRQQSESIMQHHEQGALAYAAQGLVLTIRETTFRHSEQMGGGVSIHITLDLGPIGIPWAELIPGHYERLKPNRKYAVPVVITSSLDRARLFLSGWGNYCMRVTLLF